MIERNVEPLSSENETFLMKVLKYLIVELGTIASEEAILSAIETSRFNCIPRGILAVMILNGYAKTEGDKIRLIAKKEKGGEKMEKGHSGMTPGEDKVAKAILDHFKAGFEAGRTPSEMVFKSCLKTALPKINKKVDAKNAFIKMTDNDYIRIVEGKVILGDEGKDYLSL